MTVREWDSEEHQRWSMPVEGFRSHATTDGSSLGLSGRWSACGSCLPWKAVGLTTVDVDNKGIIDELWRGEMKCIGPEATDADL